MISREMEITGKIEENGEIGKTSSKINFEKYGIISECKLEKILSGIRNVKVALVGDLCLDVYWLADMRKSELSRETPHYPLPVVQERMSPGAAGNVVLNMASLEPEKVFVIGIIGKDWRGDILRALLAGKECVDTGGIVISSTRVTEAYCKPLRKGISDVVYEDPRIDFQNYQPPSSEEEEKVIYSLEQAAGKVDVICVCDQSMYGCITPVVRNKLIKLGEDGHRIIVDSRYRIGLFRNVVLKPNEVECWRAVYGKDSELEVSLEEQVSAAVALSVNNDAKVCVTLGARGCVCADGDKATYVPSFEVKPPIDICGAGDTFLSAFSLAVASGARVEAHEAASFANMAANISITKIGTTGTASSEEIRKRYREITMAAG